MLNTESMSKSIMEERSAGVKLEVQYSVATNPAKIQDAAAGLGMEPDPSIKTISAAKKLDPKLAASMGAASVQGSEASGDAAGTPQGDTSGAAADTPQSDTSGNIAPAGAVSQDSPMGAHRGAAALAGCSSRVQ